MLGFVSTMHTENPGPALLCSGLHECVCVCAYVRKHVFVCMCLSVCLCAQVCVCVYVYVRERVCVQAKHGKPDRSE